VRALPVACLLLVLAAPAAPASAAPTAEGRLVITFADDASRGERASAHREAGARVDGRIAPLDVEIVEVAPGREAAVRRDYRTDPAVVSVELDPVVRALQDCTPDTCRLPNDPRLARQWGLQNDSRTEHRSTVFVADSDIDAPFAWMRTMGSSATRIAILDTGVDLDHPDLASQIVLSANFTKSATSDDLYGHGTHVAGVAAASGDNGEGVAGVALDASLMNVKVLDDTGAGTCATTAEGIVWAVDHGADVVGLSLGGPVGCSTQDAAIEYAVERGVLVTAGAGNGGAQTPFYPAAHPAVVAVGASDRSDLRAPFSNHGPWVDIAAPGVGILSTLPNHASKYAVRDYGYMSGTSMAAPMVAGAAALIWSSVRDANGDGRTGDDVRRRLEDFADPIEGTGSAWGAGRLNVCNAAAASLTACPSGH
jgi:thermitase